MRRGSPLRDCLVRFILQNRVVMPALSDEPNSRTLCAFAFSRIKNAHPPAQEPDPGRLAGSGGVRELGAGARFFIECLLRADLSKRLRHSRTYKHVYRPPRY